jgi:hypothetical protein
MAEHDQATTLLNNYTEAVHAYRAAVRVLRSMPANHSASFRRAKAMVQHTQRNAEKARLEWENFRSQPQTAGATG